MVRTLLSRLSCLALAAALFAPTAARAEDGHFGRRNQWFLNGSSALSFGFLTETLDGRGATQWSLSLDPRVGWFFHDNGFVALELTGGYAAGSDVSSGNVGIGPAIGFHLPMGKIAHFAPSLALLYGHVRVANSPNVKVIDLAFNASLSTISDRLGVKVAVPFVIELRPGFGITMGPTFYQDVLARNGNGDISKGTAGSLDFGLIGWI